MVEEDYKNVIKQYIDTVKEIVGDSKTFDQMFESVVKIQERVMAANNQNNDVDAVNDGEDQLKRIGSSTSESVSSTQYRDLIEEIKIIKKRILRLERKILKPKEEA
ncbi:MULTISPECIES: adhesin EplA [Ehrlichia]|uniref:Uncharacterized protein n=1 Tax=Ehrlichia cf. muris str. EmCRT TaxID=1359167 RepID=A0A0F3NBR9_9RICK|nr:MULTISPECIES: hypothetical protein [Ehrlichia]KJV65495.1 hypothetical protein EMUCRT_0439 [Ehrlichia cf. muris str. EmCRT]OUC04343.1 hypothetical protein DB91_02300 [Ehrlichia sp. Wisconsin_h]